MQASTSPPATLTAERKWAAIDARTWALGALFLAVSLDHYTFDIAGVRIKIEHIVIAVILGILLVTTLVKGRLADLRVGPLLWIVPYLAVLALSSLIMSPEPDTSLRHTAMLALLATGAYLVYVLTDTPAKLYFAVRLMIGLGILEALTTLIMLACGWVGSTIGTQPGNGYITVPYGTLWEPNILGSFLAASAVGLIALLMTAKEKRVVWLAGALGLIVAVLGLSLARAAWLGLVVGVIVVVTAYLALQRIDKPRASLDWRRALLPVALAGVGALVFLGVAAPILFPATFRGIFVRLDFRYYTVDEDPAVQARISTSATAIDGIMSSPIIGHGAGSYGVDHTGEHGEPGWISNLELHILYDSGVLGLGIFLSGFATLIWKAWKRLSTSSGGIEGRAVIIGLLGAITVLLVAFQSTEGTWLGFSWIYIGLLARAGAMPSDADKK